MRRDHSDFPQELLNHIIDNSDVDKATLKACALVARSWVYPSYTHLFHSATLLGPKALHAFVETAVTTNPVFTRSIRHLQIQHRNESGYKCTCIHPHMLTTLLRHIPNLRGIDFFGVELASSESESSNDGSMIPFDDSSPRFTLEHVGLDSCRPSDPSGFLSFLRIFEEIGSLRLTSFMTDISHPFEAVGEGDGGDEVEETVLPAMTRIRKLKFRSSPRSTGVIPFLGYGLLRRLQPETLLSLDLSLPDGPTTLAVCDFTQALAPGLHHLSLDLRFVSLGLRESHAFLNCIPNFTSLETLEISIMLCSPYMLRNTPQEIRRIFDYVISLLAALPSSTHTSLRHFRITWSSFDSSSPAHPFAHEDLNALGPVLENFKGLERVDFIWEGPSYDWWCQKPSVPANPEEFVINTLIWPEGAKTIKSLLPELRSRGILFFAFTSTC